ncbi:MAG TPA: hypothetical protein VGS28_01255 [Candidatus Saccharimonadales bacterium]|nr:hypothetical protein [Candidatus Saccharimonadales bacterium]
MNDAEFAQKVPEAMANIHSRGEHGTPGMTALEISNEVHGKERGRVIRPPQLQLVLGVLASTGQLQAIDRSGRRRPVDVSTPGNRGTLYQLTADPRRVRIPIR